jgi:hypothetical protein
MKYPTPCETLRRVLQARYPGLRVAAMESAADQQRLEFVGTREALLTSGLVQACSFAQGRARRSEGRTEFGDAWSLRALRGGRFLLRFDVEAGGLEAQPGMIMCR